MKKFRGITLVETIVTIGIMSFIMLGFTLLLSRVFVVNRFTFETGIASRIADRGVQNIVKEIRKATIGADGSFPVESATDYEFIFYSDYDNDGIAERLRYYVDGTTEEFMLGVTEPSSSSPFNYSGVESITSIAGFIVNNGAGEPVFRFYDQNNVELSPVVLSEITLVEILLFVNVDQIKAPNNVRIQSRSVIRNLSDFGEAPS